MRYFAVIGDREYEVELREASDGRLSLVMDGTEHLLDLRSVSGTTLYSAILDNRSLEVVVEAGTEGITLLVEGRPYQVRVLSEMEHRLVGVGRGLGTVHGEVAVKAPMPGLVLDVSVVPGQPVEPGQRLVILEAMKMENELRAPRAGSVKSVHVAKGDKVEQGRILVVLE
jgi:biotin carboxyl carrier protein